MTRAVAAIAALLVAGCDLVFPAPGDPAVWTAVATGVGHSCGLRDGGHLYCWGLDDFGQLGDGLAADRATPDRVGDAAWTAIAAGFKTTCGLRDGALYCWGNNDHGQLGIGTAWRGELGTVVFP